MTALTAPIEQSEVIPRENLLSDVGQMTLLSQVVLPQSPEYHPAE